jgi:hypothetical protein
VYSIYIYIYIYIHDTLQISGVCLGLFADDTCIYATDRKEGYVLRKLQRGLMLLRRVSAGTLKSMRKIQGSTSLVDVDRLSPILH